MLGKAVLLAVIAGSLFAALCSAALANAPNPTSIVVNSVKKSGSSVTVTISGTWTWDQRVPSGSQKDCNDSRSGVGYAIIWGDNTTNPLKVQGTNELVYVGNANDNWVHSVTQGTQTVDGPFKPSPSKVTESMLGETPDAVLNGFGPQGVSTGATTAIPTKADAEKWVSNCGPTAQSVVNGQTIGNSKPSEPTNGFPNGTWGPISHTYTTPGPHKICPVMYDPHAARVGAVAGNENQIIAGGNHHNGDNSIESNGNKSACVVSVEPPEPGFTVIKEQEIAGSGKGFTTAKLIGEIGQTVAYRITVKDTGTTSLTLSALTDPKCDSGTISGPSKSPIGPGESATYTCNHVLTATGIYTNVGTVTGTPPGEPPITHETPPVEVEVPPKAAFTVIKEQEIAGSGTGFTTAKLVGKIGQTVDYRITVKDTGNTSLTLSALTDPKCDSGTISGPSKSPIAPGESATYTCHHVLTATGIYTNVGTVTGTPPGEPPITHETPPVEVEVPAEPAFEIKKEQRFEGTSAYTTAKLVGTVGQRVEYKITVKDTGNTSLTLGALGDASPKCETGTLVGPSENPVGPGESATFTCSRLLPSPGVFFNAATETAESPGGAKITHTSNEVEVEAKEREAPAFEIKKEQRFAGETSYTTAKLVGKVGQRVEYKITVKNTGNDSLTLGALSDSKCESGTLSGPSENPVGVGESATFTCSFVLPSPGTFFNTATDTAESPGGVKITHTSNEVEVEAQKEPGKVHIFLGYADEGSGHASPAGHPTPWKGEAGVTFAGCGFSGTDECPKTSSGADIYDAGAIRIEAPSSESISVTGAKVVIGPCTYEPWPGLSRTIPAGGNLILTQTAKTPRCLSQTGTEVDNFDTSESFFKSKQHEEFVAGGSKLGTCKNDGFIPEITLTINAKTTTISDTGQVLNRGGIDPDICTGKGEFAAWTLVQ